MKFIIAACLEYYTLFPISFCDNYMAALEFIWFFAVLRHNSVPRLFVPQLCSVVGLT
jgi:hypothetical protein